MTEGEPASTFSEETGNLKRWRAIASLGETIVQELGLQDTNDTLARWMAHHVAEAITAAEEGDEDARRLTAELILRIWDHRTSWPHGWPPAGLGAVIAELMPVEATQPVGVGTDEASTFAQLVRLQKEETRLWAQLVFADADVKEDEATVGRVAGELDEGEADALARILSGHLRALELFATAGVGDSSVGRREYTVAKLRDLAQRREALVAMLERGDESTPSRRRRGRTGRARGRSQAQ